MTELTEAEIERLAITAGMNADYAGMVDVVRDLIEARLAPIRALADQWEHRSQPGSIEWMYGEELHAALSAPLTAPDATDGPQGHRDADDGPSEATWRLVHNHSPYRPQCNEREVGGQLRGACLNDDGSPR